jgi:hypothetical protein
VTFTAGSANYNFLTFAEVKAQIEASVAGLLVLQDAGELVFIESTPTNGVSITGGTGAAIVGITATAQSSVFSYPDGVSAPTLPFWVSTYYDGGYHVLITQE